MSAPSLAKGNRTICHHAKHGAAVSLVESSDVVNIVAKCVRDCDTPFARHFGNSVHQTFITLGVKCFEQSFLIVRARELVYVMLIVNILPNCVDVPIAFA